MITIYIVIRVLQNFIVLPVVYPVPGIDGKGSLYEKSG